MGKKTKRHFYQFLAVGIVVMLLQPAGLLKAHSFNSESQITLLAYQDTLRVLGDSILHGSNNEVRRNANSSFKSALERALRRDGAFAFGFDSVKTLGRVIAPDNTFKIYNWILPAFDGTGYSYFGFVQAFDKAKQEISLFPLTDSSKTLVNPQTLKLRNDNWYGALYYKILKNKKGGKDYYTLLGWHGVNQNTTQKIIDVIYFNSGKPMFGYSLFKTDKVYKSRIIFEYNAQTTMSLKYEEGQKMIVFDHLSAADAERNSSLSGPDGTYDGFRFKGDHWLYMKDIDMRTKWEPKKQPKNPPPHEPPIEK